MTAWQEQRPWIITVMETAPELVVQNSLQVPFSTVYFFEQFCCVRSHTFSLQFPISESDKLPFHIMKILAQQTALLIHKLLNFPAFEAAKRWKRL